MVTLWLMGTWVAMETCIKSKSILGDWLQLRRMVGTICSSAALPRVLFYASSSSSLKWWESQSLARDF